MIIRKERFLISLIRDLEKTQFLNINESNLAKDLQMCVLLLDLLVIPQRENINFLLIHNQDDSDNDYDDFHTHF